MDSLDTFDNPLVSRYAGPEMVALWTPRRRYGTWRRLYDHWLGHLGSNPTLPAARYDG